MQPDSLQKVLRSEKFNVLLIILSFLSFLPSFFIPVLSSDEMTWLSLSRYVFDERLYQFVSDNKPPFHFQWLYLVSLGAQSLLAMKLFLIAWAALSAILLRKILSKFVTIEMSSAAALFFALASGLINRGAYSGERVAVGFMLLAVYILVFKKNRISIMVFLSGVFAAAAIMIKPNILIAAVPALFFLGENLKQRLCAFMVFVLGADVFSLVSFALVQSDPYLAFHESFLLASKYAGKASGWNWHGIKDRFGNSFTALGIFYLPMSLLSLYCLIKKQILSRKLYLGLLSFLIAGFLSVSLGFRFYQQYFSLLLPALAAFASPGFLLKPKFFKKMLFVQIFILVAIHSHTVFRQISGQNRNWNSKLQEVVHVIDEQSEPNDSVWISSSIYSAYFFSETVPASKYLLMLYYTGFQDPCQSEAANLKESLEDPLYQSLLSDLTERNPKLIFWTQSAKNNCSDRYHLQNFPSLEKLINQKYKLDRKLALGDLYVLK